MDIPVENTADAYLEILSRRGVKYFFRQRGHGLRSPGGVFFEAQDREPALPHAGPLPHEATAVSMAHGYYMVTGEPQAAMVHVTVGTANAAAQIMNAAKAHVPVLFTAGRTPINEEGVPGHRASTFTGPRNRAIRRE